MTRLEMLTESTAHTGTLNEVPFSYVIPIPDSVEVDGRRFTRDRRGFGVCLREIPTSKQVRREEERKWPGVSVVDRTPQARPVFYHGFGLEGGEGIVHLAIGEPLRRSRRDAKRSLSGEKNTSAFVDYMSQEGMLDWLNASSDLALATYFQQPWSRFHDFAGIGFLFADTQFEYAKAHIPVRALDALELAFDYSGLITQGCEIRGVGFHKCGGNFL